jgi:hypothetical protein
MVLEEKLGLIWKTDDGIWHSKCSKCQSIVNVSYKANAVTNVRKNRKCASCSSKIKVNLPNFNFKPGHIHSNECKEKISNSVKRVMYRPDIRKKHIDAIETLENKEKLSITRKLVWQNPESRKRYYESLIKTKFLGRRCDIGQPELIEKWNRLGFNFQLNYPLYFNQILFYIDGYDKEKNVIFEYDGKYHHSKSQKEKDLIRQNKIIEILKPKKFWRYDSVNKKFTEIIGENKL